MTRSWIITYVIIFFCLSSGEHLCAQSAFDPNCYRPTPGNGIDTYMKSYKTHAEYGFEMLRLPPPNGDSKHYYIGRSDINPPYNTLEFETDSPFSVNNLKQVKDMGMYISSDVIFGHFHNSKQLDMLYAINNPVYPGKVTIFWADENGNYDTLRYTNLISTVRGDLFGGFGMTDLMLPYVAHLTSDTVDDIIFLGFTHWLLSESTDSAKDLALLFQGGEKLYKSDTLAYNDSLLSWGPTYDSTGYPIGNRYATIGDFRGTGRKDWIASDEYGNIFFFKNDPPFSMQKFLDGGTKDTILSASQDTNIYYGDGIANRFTMRALPRQSGDSSVDFIPRFYTKNGYLTNSLWVYRGGPDFGSKRLTLDTTTNASDSFQQAELVIRNPGLYDGHFFSDLDFGSLCYNAGDMTGTGRPVMLVRAGYDHSEGFDLYYVLGDASDEQIDMMVGTPCTNPISVDADGDKYRDLVYGLDTDFEGGSDTPDSAGIWVLHGSPKIPVHLNAKYSVATQDVLDTSISHILAYPNPFDEKTVLTFENCSGAQMTMQVTSATGTICLNEEIPAVDGLQAYGADLSKLSAGMYFIRLECPSAHWSGTVSVVKTGAARSGM